MPVDNRYDPTKPTLTKSEVEHANSQTKSCSAAARYLKVNYDTYKKWAKKYGLFESQKNMEGVGIPNPNQVSRGEYSLKRIVVEGTRPDYDTGKLKGRLIRAGWKDEECERCGFSESREDGIVPLVLRHVDGDHTNHLWENLEMVCYNCCFVHYGDIPRRKIELEYER
jgi:hypothetical protein